MDWWDLGEWSGTPGQTLAIHQIGCAFCGAEGSFEIINHVERKKAGSTCAVVVRRTSRSPASQITDHV
ncbi:MAG TPA: hypothetical protein VGH70_13635, partial [Bradyrhizobium sp.]